MAEPTDEQLKQYAEKLPDVYRTALGAFIQVFDDGTAVRRAGTQVAFSRITSEVLELHPALSEQDVKTVLDQLIKAHFIKDVAPYKGLEDFPTDQFRRCVPTPLGERLIAAVTGIEPVPELIPALPEPVWA